jgi:Peptidase A4 family
MATKHKKQLGLLVTPSLLVGLFVACCGSLGAQVEANLAAKLAIIKPDVAAQVIEPLAQPTHVLSSATTAPAAAPAPVSTSTVSLRHVVSYGRGGRPVAVVVPAPHSNVSHLVPVTEPVPSTTPGTVSGTPPPTPSPIPAPSPPPVTVTGYESSNWSGYMATAGGYSGISGDWRVPTVTGSGAAVAADAAWIGIGGVTSEDLIQVGTMDQVSGDGQAGYEAFYEMLPAVSTPVPGMTVNPGDAMFANLTETSTSIWKITISDLTQNESFATTVAYASSKSSAEWIEEDPSFGSGGLIPFDNFGSVTFTAAQTVQNGAAVNLIGANVSAITMVNYRGQAVATPSAVSADGESFRVDSG